MKTNKKIGISLIVIIITIIVIIILAGAVILNLNKNNPMESAKKATFLNDLKNFDAELNLYKIKQNTDNLGEYNSSLLNANGVSVTYNSIIDSNKTINDLIPSLKTTPKYNGKFQIINGILIFGGLDTKEQDWARESGIEVVIEGEPNVTIEFKSEPVVARGTDIVYTVEFASNNPLLSIDLTNKIELVNSEGIALSTQPDMIIGTISGTNLDIKRHLDITIKTDGLESGTYKLKAKAGSATNINNITNTIDIISPVSFDIDNTPPESPIILPDITIFTNKRVTVTITYSTDSVNNQYKIGDQDWQSYTEPFLIDSNCVITATATDNFSNSSSSTLNITNISSLPYQKQVPVGWTGIYTLNDFNQIRNNLNGKYILMEYLDLNVAPYNQNAGWSPIGTFNGEFDGNGLDIKNLYIKNTANMYCGFFSTLSTSAIVKNLNLVNCNISNTYDSITGGIAAVVYGKITNCSVSGSISGVGMVGGYCGFLYNAGMISDCKNSSSVTASTWRVAGITGWCNAGTIVNCYNVGNITCTGYYGPYNASWAGGIYGDGYGGSVTNCYNVGNITGGSRCVGGIAGGSDTPAIFKNVYNTGTIKGGGTYASAIETGSNYTGYILGQRKSAALNTYYLNITTTVLKGWTNANILTYLGSKYTKDINNINNGYPVLNWQLIN